MTETSPVTCPTCFEVFEVPLPPVGETPCEIDYDCEVCCRPMVIVIDAEPGTDLVQANARGLDD